jgi:outer membrane protein
MKRLKSLVPLVFALLFVVAGLSFAQQTGKIAIINSQKAFEISAEGKKALAQMQDRDTKIRAELQKQDDAIRALENKLTTGRLTMTADALRAIQADLERKTTERKRYEEDQARDANAFANNIITKIREEMVIVIEALRKEQGYDIVLDLGTSGAVTFNPAIEITDEVVRRYDASKAAAPPVKK